MQWRCYPQRQAELFDRGGGLIYDDVLDITWLQDANLAGPMNWADWLAWADELNYGGYDDWRLASMDVNGDDIIVNCDGATESACRDNELGYMYYQNLMGNFSEDLTGAQGLFINIQFFHWSGTEYLSSSDRAWSLHFNSGLQVFNLGGGSQGAWPVRQGDVTLDTDADGVEDSADNCSVIANPDQRDTNGDGYGNVCDPDLNNDGIVNFADLPLWVPFFNTATSGDADFNGDGFANFADFAKFPDYFLQPPGPSGIVP